MWQMVQQNCWEETTNSMNPLRDVNKSWGARVSAEILMAQRKSLNLQNKRMKRQFEKISGLYSEISSTVITLNREFNFVRQQNKHSLFHWNTLMLQGQQKQIWTLHQKYELMIVGTLLERKNCQIHEQVSQNSLCWKRHLQKIHVVRVEIDTKSDDVTSRSFLAWSLDKNWESRSKKRKTRWALKKKKLKYARSLRKFIPLIRVMKTTRTSLRMRDEKLEMHVAPAMPCIKNDFQSLQSGNRCFKNSQSQSIWGKDKIQLYCRSTWIHETLNWIGSKQNSWRSNCWQRTKFNIALQFTASKFRSRKQWHFPDAKAAVDKEWKKLETIPPWRLEKAKANKEVIKEA